MNAFRNEIYFMPKARLSFKQEEIQLLFRCAERHYDTACRKAGEQEGILWRIRFRHTAEEGHYNADATTSLDSKEIDLLCKILEQRTGMSADDYTDAFDLTKQLRSVLRQMNETVWNPIPCRS